MNNSIITILDNLILGMREGRIPEDILQDDNMKKEISKTYMPILTQENAVETAKHIVNELYDGKFPIDHLEFGDICIDAFGCSPCIITNINDRSIHVLYFNGKTHKFKRSQERYFKKLGQNMKEQLTLFMDDCDLMYRTNMEMKKRPGYDFPIAAKEEDAE